MANIQKKSIRLFTSWAIVILIFPFFSYAEETGEQCFQSAAQRYQVDENLLRAIAWVESRNKTDAHRENKNGTEDVCIMQINSMHFKRLKRFGIEREHLVYDLCTCINVGAYILAEEISRVGYFWRAIAYYHSRNPERGQKYAAKVEEAYNAFKNREAK